MSSEIQRRSQLDAKSALLGADAFCLGAQALGLQNGMDLHTENFSFPFGLNHRDGQA